MLDELFEEEVVIVGAKTNYYHWQTVWQRRGEIGKQVADTLGIPFYDKELLALAAKESGMSRLCSKVWMKRVAAACCTPFLPGFTTLVAGRTDGRAFDARPALSGPVRCDASYCRRGLLRYRGPLQRLCVGRRADALLCTSMRRRFLRSGGSWSLRGWRTAGRARWPKWISSALLYYNYYTGNKWARRKLQLVV
jgi:hypothetical protein